MRKGAFSRMQRKLRFCYISFERVSEVLANGAIGSVIAVMDPKLRHFETEQLPNSICKTALLPFS